MTETDVPSAAGAVWWLVLLRGAPAVGFGLVFGITIIVFRLRAAVHGVAAGP